jgi:hypothetical protein
MIAAHIESILIVTGAGDRAHQLVSPVAESLSRVPMLRKGPLSLLHWNTLGIKNRITSG